MISRAKTEQIRNRIVEATDALLYRKGFNLMSFTDIAEAADVPRGNIYYYFKTKEEVLGAVVEHRLDRMRPMLAGWEADLPTPLERLVRYARLPLDDIDAVVRLGCPLGSLNSELGKCQPELQAMARGQFDLLREWLAGQFARLAPGRDADALALHLLTLNQGAAVLGQAYGDRGLVEREVASAEDWLLSLAGA
jgi:AcrR family transcriptional regulator